MLACDNNSHSFGFGTLGLLMCVPNNLYSVKVLNCITYAVSFTHIFPNYITQFDTQCSVYSLQNCLQGCQTFLLLAIHNAPSFDFCTLSPLAYHLPSPGFCDIPLAFIFILYSFFSAHNPTESWLSFLCRLWPWCIYFPIRGSRILGDPRGRVGKNHLWEKLPQLHSKGPLSGCLVNSPHQSFQFYLHTLAAVLGSNCEGSMCADR